jgi:hypothetical protein
MNSDAIIDLIADLYVQVRTLAAENQQLRAELAKNSAAEAPEKP